MTIRSLEAITTTVGDLSDYDAEEIARRLTITGSEFQAEILDRSGSLTPITIIRESPFRVVAWAATHHWRGMQTLEGFTRVTHRRRGFFRSAAALLVSSGAIATRLPVAVFSGESISIARSVGCRELRLYGRRDGDWKQNS